MKVYFAGSIRGGRDDVELYEELIKYIQTKAEVLTEHVGSKSLISMGEDGKTDKYIHDRDMEWLLSSDMVIAEVSTPSLGVGYEIARAVENGVTVYTLFRTTEGKKLSAMVAGCEDVNCYEYSNLEQAKGVIDGIFEDNK